MSYHHHSQARAIVSLLLALIGACLMIAFAIINKPERPLRFETEAEALEHCANPVLIAGPINEEPRGWMCP